MLKFEKLVLNITGNNKHMLRFLCMKVHISINIYHFKSYMNFLFSNLVL